MAKKRGKNRGRSAAFMRSINPYLNKRRSKTKSQGVKMGKTKRSRSRRGSSRMGGILGKIGAPLIYGMIRSKTSDMIAPYAAKLPLGNVSDEAGMFILAEVAKRTVAKNGIARDIANTAQIVELSRIGDAVISGQLNLGGSTNVTSSYFA